ncbi:MULTISPECIES: ATP-binding protein [Nocardioides]|nr:ATP-binding protein [Nocardioides sp. CGMCC 1.13656]
MRTLRGILLAVGLPVLLTMVLVPLRDQVNLVSDMLLFLLVTVVVGYVGGMVSTVVAAVVSTALLNYFFTPPLHTLAISDANNAIALVVFVTVAVLVSYAVDLAARRTRQAAEAEAEARALAAGNEMRTALLAAVGHDLRTPLAAAKASVSGLRSVDQDLSPGDRVELVEVADESLDRLAELVDNLLDMSRLNAGALTLRLSPTALDEVVARSLDDLGDGAARVDVVLAEDLPSIHADGGLLERVFANLLTNAVRYSPPGRPVHVVAVVKDETLEVRVVDHGPGIPSADRDRVFLPFQRLGDTDNTTGVGLGLALSRGLTEAMGGTLEPEETPGGGLTLVLTLRIAREPAAEPGHRERSGSAP